LDRSGASYKLVKPRPEAEEEESSTGVEGRAAESNRPKRRQGKKRTLADLIEEGAVTVGGGEGPESRKYWHYHPAQGVMAIGFEWLPPVIIGIN